MAKNIILLSDGTGNSVAQIWKTNVWRLYQALDLTDRERQIAFYDDGVGSSSFKPWAVVTGAVGIGLKRNLLDLYTFLCRSYEPGTKKVPGDQIYCFGFSRGAYTIRELIAFIALKGLVRLRPGQDLRAEATEAYREYRAEMYGQGRHVLANAGRTIRDVAVDLPERLNLRHEEADLRPHRPRIRFLGLWDTVAAYGLPIEEVKRAVDLYFMPLSFPDRILSEKVDRACHAVSLDDERLTFHPVLWTEEYQDKNGTKKKERVFPGTYPTPKGQKRITNVRHERISQVWFAGVHSNVGGGYPDDSLAHVPLKWMVNEAAQCGLKFKSDARKQVSETANSRGRIYDSRHGLAAYYRYAPRKMQSLIREMFDKENQVSIEVPKIHESVFERIKDGNTEYAPIVLPERYAVVANDGVIRFGASNPYEHPTQSLSRANVQERVWNVVWGRRISYFLTLIASLYLVAFPIMFEATKDGACWEGLCFLSPIIGAVGAVLPGFLSPWVDAYRSHPGAFFVGIFFLGVFLWVGSYLQKRISAEMRQLWLAIEKRRQPVTPEKLPENWIYWLRTRPAYQWFFLSLRRTILPSLIALAVLLAVPAILNRISFSVISATGNVCESAVALVGVPGKVTKDGFSSKSGCWATGLWLQEGTTYRITIERAPDSEPWKDRRPKNSALVGYGFRDLAGDGDWRRFFGALYTALYRRSLSANWLQPIARIGVTGTDEYRLDPSLILVQDQLWTKLVSDMQARTSGELFLFVNSAVIGWPSSYDYFYKYNSGVATVTIEPQ